MSKKEKLEDQATHVATSTASWFDIDGRARLVPDDVHLASCQEPSPTYLTDRRMREIHADLDKASWSSDGDALGLMREREAAFRHEYALHLHELRLPYVGKVTPLHGRLAEPLNPDNPFAFDAFFDGYCDEAYELRPWKFGSITEDGLVIKANTRHDVARMASTMKNMQPLMRHFGLFRRVSHIFALTGEHTMGDTGVINGRCTQYRLLDFSEETNWRLFPAVIACCSDIPADMRIETMLHELAHVDFGEHGHGELFLRKFGEMVAWYLSQSEAPHGRSLAEWLMNGEEPILLPASFLATGGDLSHEMLRMSLDDVFVPEA